MKLLEVVRGGGSSLENLAACVKLGKTVGKMPVIAGNCFGEILSVDMSLISLYVSMGSMYVCVAHAYHAHAYMYMCGMHIIQYNNMYVCCIVMHCIVLYCIVLHCIVLYSPARLHRQPHGGHLRQGGGVPGGGGRVPRTGGPRAQGAAGHGHGAVRDE
jgi:hypothetical protein